MRTLGGEKMNSARSVRRLRRSGRPLVVVAAGAGLLAVLASVAVAATFNSLGVGMANVSGKSESIVVDGRGVTVYELGGESLAHLQCQTRACFNIWIPVKVSSAGVRLKTASRVPGKLSVFRRVKGGFYQAMLDKHPLYYYSGDNGRKGSAKGQGINSFGGRWHVIPAGPTTSSN